METKAASKWLRRVGYPLFFLATFLFFFGRTLPFAALEARAVEEARKAGYTLSVVSLTGSGLFGVTAKGVSITPIQKQAPAPDAPPVAGMLIDQLSVRPTLFPLGVHFSAKAFGGTAEGSLASRAKGAESIDVTLNKVDAAKLGLKPILGVDLAGTLTGSTNLNLPADFPKAAGTIKLSGRDLTINGGTVSMIDLPKVSLGTLDLVVKAEAGKATLDTLNVSGGDVEAKGEGDITLNSRPAASNIKIKLAFKPNDEWLKKNSFIQMGLSQIGHADGKGFYTATLDGMVGNPRPALH